MNPLSALFGAAVRIRNELYDNGTLSTRRLEAPVISIGNITVGGSGKTPFLILLAVFFWSFLWGIPGAFIGVPMTLALLTVCEQSPSTRWLATLLSGSAGGKT